ncbi:MAG: MarC family transcriptional regulator [Halobacteriovorax sp.]|nr:MarC family transcriptional regulator [Halobacteriovorax sp.]
MIDFESLISSFIVLWAVIDPIGTIPVFIAVTKNYKEEEKKRIALVASSVAFLILLFFLVIGEILLRKMGVPLPAFQVSGGVILLIFAIDMIFGDSKPEGELELLKSAQETAIFPLAIPSIAGPGAILAIILLTDNSRHSIVDQIITASMMLLVIVITYIFMRISGPINKKIGRSGAIVISKVMGLILASIAATNILIGIKEFFKL